MPVTEWYVERQEGDPPPQGVYGIPRYTTIFEAWLKFFLFFYVMEKYRLSAKPEQREPLNFFNEGRTST